MLPQIWSWFLSWSLSLVRFVFLSISWSLSLVRFVFLSISWSLSLVRFVFLSISWSLSLVRFVFLSISWSLSLVRFVFLSISCSLSLVKFLFCLSWRRITHSTMTAVSRRTQSRTKHTTAALELLFLTESLPEDNRYYVSWLFSSSFLHTVYISFYE